MQLSFFSSASILAMSVEWLHVGLLVHQFSSDLNISTMIEWIAVKRWTNNHGPQRMDPTGFDDPLTFLKAPHYL